MMTMKAHRRALAAGALFVFFGLAGCIAEPFGHGADRGGEGRERHGGEDRDHHGLRNQYRPAPDALPIEDAGDTSEHQYARWPSGEPLQVASGRGAPALRCAAGSRAS